MSFLDPLRPLLTPIWQALALFVGLNIIYRVLYKARRERSDVARILIPRTRFWVYSSTIVASILWMAYISPPFPSQELITKLFENLLLLFIGVTCTEVVATLTFEYIIPKKKKVEVPLIIKELTRIVVYLTLLFVVLRVVYDVNITPLLTTSAIVSVILGFALQETLGNLFSGVAMHLSKPYSVGDWIRVGGYEGEVEKVDWRSTAIKTFSGDYVVLPNSYLAKQELLNYSTPSKLHARYLDVGTHYDHPPNLVKKALIDIALSTDGIVHDPQPQVFVTKYNDFSVDYRLKLWINDYSRKELIEAAVMEKIWYRFKRDGIRIPFPIRDLYLHEKRDAQTTVEEMSRLLGEVDFLKELSQEYLQDLARKARLCLFAAGETVCRQGEQGETFYVIRKGTVQVEVRDSRGQVALTKDLHKGDWFGEMSLLTGEPRSATVAAQGDTQLYMLGKEDFRALLLEVPFLDECISRKIAERKSEIEEVLAGTVPEAAQEQERKVGDRSRQILNKIRSFFAY